MVSGSIHRLFLIYTGAIIYREPEGAYHVGAPMQVLRFMIFQLTFDVFSWYTLGLRFLQRMEQESRTSVLAHLSVKEKTTRRNGMEGTFHEQQNQAELFTS